MSTGWNWVSYPFYKPLALQNVIAGAEEGDYITSHQDGFAEYADGQWQGTLNILSPGNGYLYKSSSRKAFEIDFFAQTTPSLANVNDDTATESTLTVDSRMYPSTFNVIAVLNGDGLVMSEDCQLYALVGNECRGVGKNIGGKYFVTVYGDGAATVKFLVKNMRTGQEYEAEETLTFLEECRGIGQYVKDKIYMVIFGDSAESVEISFKAYEVATGETLDISEHVAFKEDKLGSTASPFILNILGDTSVSGIESDVPASRQIYNIMGQRLNNTSRSGVYVIDSRKVIVE